MDEDKKAGLSVSEAMDKYSQFEGSTPKEKIMNAYAQLRTKSNPGPDASATPSSAGDIEPSAPVPVPETAPPLSVRVDKEPTHHTLSEATPATAIPPVEPVGMGPPQDIVMQHTDVQTIQPSALSVMHTEDTIPGSVYLGPSEFAIPLPMDSRVKDDYEKVLTSESQSIRNFLNITSSQTEIPENQEQLVSTINQVLERLSNVTTHPDLNVVEHIKDSESDVQKEAAWAEYSSAKFLLLGYLLQVATMHDIHLVITVNGEKSQRVVERYLLGKGLMYTRPRQEMGSGTNVEVSLIKESLSFGVQSTVNDGVMETYKAPSAIIALDPSFNAKSPTVEHMRTTFARNGNLLPVIRLMVSNSSEHIGLCFPGLPELERLRLLIQYTTRLRNSVGDLQDDALGVNEDAEELLSCLESDNFNAHWSLPHVEPLLILSPEELESTQQELQSRPSVDVSYLTTPQIQKRAFEEESAEPSSKRPRIEESQDPSQFTESTKFPSQTLDGELRSLERNLVQMKSSHGAELDKLQKSLAEVQARLQEKETVLGKLQHRYETRTREIHQIKRERDRLTEAKTTSDQRSEKQKEDISKLKDERTQLRHELEQARESIKAGGGSSAELESAREEIRRLNEESSSLQRKAEYEARQAEYTREQYQTASTVAAQSGNEARQLREENETLKQKVAGDASRLRELNTKNDEARHLERVLELESLLQSREDLLRRKEEEVRELRKNRPSTRSTSTQPRSPKWTAGNSRPTSPGITNNSNNNGSSLAGRGSALRFSEVR
ncbi:HDA1 complex subunit [Aspergillus ellipticus CBS 707.79]|uniref:HDA1 complex subunit n=1 Tax=Aspergillus ellipticus CBS 707.79 TaxID=1448320 RepID=A0A319DF82_9EURO|nr:HDA1 complex subunit [Aspergillus ellipticus CBS 707.79]